MPTTLSLPEARRLAIAAQAFGPKPTTASIAHVRKLATRLHAFQIDSVNVLVRAHYMPAFARLVPGRRRGARCVRRNRTGRRCTLAVPTVWATKTLPEARWSPAKSWAASM